MCLAENDGIDYRRLCAAGAVFSGVFQDTGKPARISKIQIYKNLYGGYIPLMLKIITPIIIIVKIWGNVL